jgi:hypothetical protein
MGWEVVMAKSGILSWHLPGGTGESHKNNRLVGALAEIKMYTS